MKSGSRKSKVVVKKNPQKKHPNQKKANVSDKIISLINIVLYNADSEGKNYSFISEAVRTLIGYTPEDVYQNKVDLSKIIYKPDIQQHKNFIKNLEAGIESTVEYRIKDRFGKEHWVRNIGIPIINDNKTIQVVGTIQDITEEKKVLLRLENSEERFRMLIDTADDLIFVLNGFGYFDMVNKNGATALSYTPDEIKGRHFLEFIDKEDEERMAESITKILNSTGITTFETFFLDRYEKGVAFEISAKPIISDGEITGMLGIGRNITNRKLDEQKIKDLNAKLVEANRIISIERERARHKITVLEELGKLKSEFISNVSHELRTPLASIVGFAETLLSEKELPNETIREFSNIILMEGKRLGKLINDILDFSKLESGEEELHKESVILSEIVDNVLQSFENQIKEKDLVLTKDYAQGKITIDADKERLKKIFWNLISNAIKFTNSGGRISIIIQDFGKEIEIIVSDTGIGISENDLPKLFQKFSKIQQNGTPLSGAGFGLVTTKQIVDLHKGFIKLRSQLDKGTTVIIRLPKQ